MTKYLRTCVVCGKSIQPTRCCKLDSARYERRVCCSRACAVRMPPRPETVKARQELAAMLKKAPPEINNAGVIATRKWVAATQAARAVVKRGGLDICRWHADQVREAVRQLSGSDAR